MPAAGDTVIVREGATLTVDVDNAVVGTLELGSPAVNENGALAFNAGSILYVSTLNVGHTGAPGTNTGSIDMTNGGQLVLADTVAWNNAGNTWTPGSGTVVYGKPDNQNIPSAFHIGITPTYNNLIVSSLNTKTITGSDITVNGNLTIDASTTLAAAGFYIHVKGNWVNDGSFTSGGGAQVVYFDGAGGQNIGGTASYEFQSFNSFQHGWAQDCYR